MWAHNKFLIILHVKVVVVDTFTKTRLVIPSRQLVSHCLATRLAAPLGCVSARARQNVQIAVPLGEGLPSPDLLIGVGFPAVLP